MSLLIGALGSLIASVVEVVALRLLRPKFQISKEISAFVTTQSERVYRIKVVNRSHVAAVAIRVKLHRLDKRPAPSGEA